MDHFTTISYIRKAFNSFDVYYIYCKVITNSKKLSMFLPQAVSCLEKRPMNWTAACLSHVSYFKKKKLQLAMMFWSLSYVSYFKKKKLELANWHFIFSRLIYTVKVYMIQQEFCINSKFWRICKKCLMKLTTY